MAKRKPTIGEREEMRRFKLTLEEVRSSGHAKNARRIDRVVRQAFRDGEYCGDLKSHWDPEVQRIRATLRAKYGVKP